MLYRLKHNAYLRFSDDIMSGGYYCWFKPNYSYEFIKVEEKVGTVVTYSYYCKDGPIFRKKEMKITYTSFHLSKTFFEEWFIPELKSKIQNIL